MKTLLLLFSFLVSLNSFARLSESFWISDPEHKHLKIFKKNTSLVIDHVTSLGYELYGPQGTEEYLKQNHIIFTTDEIGFKNKSEYPSYEEITKSIKSIVAKYPNIMELSSIGQSVEGRELWMVKVSDNVKIDEVEPEFKYISSMHGDEIVGRELMILFLEDLGKNYGVNQKITDLINSTEIYIMPSMNPDGSERARRWNANGVDLNRNFPDFTRNEENSFFKREIEVIHIMNFQKTRNFSLSANFHGGAVVVNYPWDSTYELHPQDELIKGFSKGYADLNGPMRESNEFPGGIVNGARWYVVKGGMQDWSSAYHGDLQVTIELSDIKWPDYSQIDQFYRDNKDSLYYYLEQIHHGAGFSFAIPELEGTVEINKVDKDISSRLGTFGFSKGEFYKVLPKGRYLFKIHVKDKIITRELGVSGLFDGRVNIKDLTKEL